MLAGSILTINCITESSYQGEHVCLSFARLKASFYAGWPRPLNGAGGATVTPILLCYYIKKDCAHPDTYRCYPATDQTLSKHRLEVSRGHFSKIDRVATVSP